MSGMTEMMIKHHFQHRVSRNCWPSCTRTELCKLLSNLGHFFMNYGRGKLEVSEFQWGRPSIVEIEKGNENWNCFGHPRFTTEGNCLKFFPKTMRSTKLHYSSFPLEDGGSEEFLKMQVRGEDLMANLKGLLITLGICARSLLKVHYLECSYSCMT